MNPQTLADLQHTTIKIPNTDHGEVIVLNSGAILTAESQAMLQALHSRSIGGLKSHLETLVSRGADNFMKNFYVGYGHASIGDCGNTVLFIEGISMLVAKAIQDWRLYSGQEASTRYIDFQVQPFLNPAGTPDGVTIQESWRSFYIESLPVLVEDLKKRYPMDSGEKEATYDKAINARAFDILRGFLPAGSTTNIAWSTNLRQAADALRYLRHHPLQEVRDAADAIEKALQEAHPNSFGHKRYEETEGFNKTFMEERYYYHNPKLVDGLHVLRDDIDTTLLADEYSKTLRSRPAKTEPPRQLAEAGTMRFEFPLDFGSYRDIQRHRAVVQRMPLLTRDIGFEGWYLGELPEELRKNAEKLLGEQEDRIAKLDLTKEVAQYYTAMGYKTSNRLTGDLAALVYLVELRATRFVHPTLRLRAQQMATELTDRFGDSGLVIHLDEEADRFDIKRGEQDIVLKEESE